MSAADDDELHRRDPVGARTQAAEVRVCAAVTPVLAAAGVPGATVHAPKMVGYLRRFGFAFAFVGSPVQAATADRYLAMALDITIVEGHGGPRTCGAGMALMPPLSHPRNPGTSSLARVGPSRSPATTAVLRWPATTSPCLSLIVVPEGPLR